jgi:hypothetical protein
MAGAREPVRVSLTLDGPRDAVMAIVSLAVSESVLSAMEVAERSSVAPVAATFTPNAPVDPVSGMFRPGDRVTQIGYSGALGLAPETRGQHGTVSTVLRSGKGHRIIVRWDSGASGPAYGRLLRPFRS